MLLRTYIRHIFCSLFSQSVIVHIVSVGTGTHQLPVKMYLILQVVWLVCSIQIVSPYKCKVGTYNSSIIENCPKRCVITYRWVNQCLIFITRSDIPYLLWFFFKPSFKFFRKNDDTAPFACEKSASDCKLEFCTTYNDFEFCTSRPKPGATKAESQTVCWFMTRENVETRVKELKEAEFVAWVALQQQVMRDAGINFEDMKFPTIERNYNQRVDPDYGWRDPYKYGTVLNTAGIWIFLIVMYGINLHWLIKFSSCGCKWFTIYRVLTVVQCSTLFLIETFENEKKLI